MLWSFKYIGHAPTISPPRSATRCCGTQPVSSSTHPVASSASSQSQRMNGEAPSTKRSQSSRGISLIARTIRIVRAIKEIPRGAVHQTIPVVPRNFLDRADDSDCRRSGHERKSYHFAARRKTARLTKGPRNLKFYRNGRLRSDLRRRAPLRRLVSELRRLSGA